LYAGKLVAALDRQHPRDLFDVRGLLSKEGLTEGLREASTASTTGRTAGWPTTPRNTGETSTFTCA